MFRPETVYIFGKVATKKGSCNKTTKSRNKKRKLATKPNEVATKRKKLQPTISKLQQKRGLQQNHLKSQQKEKTCNETL
jgi:hypothetical protein